MACITMLNKIGLSTDPWCTPTLTSKLSLSSPFLLTAVVTPSYILLMTFTIHSSTPTCLKAEAQPGQNFGRRKKISGGAKKFREGQKNFGRGKKISEAVKLIFFYYLHLL